MTSNNSGLVIAKNLPSISVITICKNAGLTIGRTLASVASCKYPHLQYVIVDGGSTDDTCSQILSHGVRVDKFISEPDRGISDALNKAVELSDGDYHLIVHADDELNNNSLAILTNDPAGRAAQVISGSVLVTRAGLAVRKFSPEPRKLFEKMSVPHMGSLISKKAWRSVGGYDVRRKIAMDHLLMLRILKRFGLNGFHIVDTVVANYFLGGISDRHAKLGFCEVRDNLIEEGVGRIRAEIAYLQLLAKMHIAGFVRR